MDVVTESVVATALRTLPGPEPRLVAGGNFGTPWELVRLADNTLERCRLLVMNPQAGWPRRYGMVTESPFLGAGVRNDPTVDYLPMRLSLVPALFGSVRPPDAVLIHTSTPRHGKVSLGIEVNILPAAIEAARRRGGLVIAQLNASMPYTHGDAEIDVDQIDLAVEASAALPTPAQRPPDDVASRIGELVATMAIDGATLQVGIGQVPDAALGQMHARRSLGVWSELISDGVLSLERAGSLDRSRVMTTSFLLGSAEFYAWADDNPRLIMRRTETVNDPARIAAQPAMFSLNTAIEIDLFAQANASYVRGAIYSGFGGQPDFVGGALHSRGGHAVIALRSWHEKSDHSCVVPILHDPVCSFQHSEVVTEQGIAAISGQSQRTQARRLIDEAAHPRVRDELREAAGSLGLASLAV
jgi:acyl-CoA hydrolase